MHNDGYRLSRDDTLFIYFFMNINRLTGVVVSIHSARLILFLRSGHQEDWCRRRVKNCDQATLPARVVPVGEVLMELHQEPGKKSVRRVDFRGAPQWQPLVGPGIRQEDG
jgi:hypothetical protein